MKLAVTIGCVLTIGIAFASAAQRKGQGAPPALIIDSIAGPDSFAFYCAPCHGRGGKGDGPVAAALKAPTPDLTTLAKRNGGTFPRAEVTSFVTGTGRTPTAHGPGDMPIWGPIFRSLDPSDTRTKLRIENVVAFIESIQIK
jgi:mono/diheme cytochrome c family protein